MTTTAAHDLVVAARTTEPDTDLVAVRAWARSVGYPVDESACVPADVLQTYRRVHAPLH
ncbi:MAG: hypothetical protein JWO60_3227 [Frankiales bacterium]|nr:hypothetical protein [Frankiales bacterium]